MRVEPDRSPEVAALLARVWDGYDTSGGAFTLEDAMNGPRSLVYAARDESGALLLAWAMELNRDRRGVEAYVTACAGVGMLDVLPACERIARELGANRLAFRTMRHGMTHKMMRQGYKPRCVEMEKTL